MVAALNESHANWDTTRGGGRNMVGLTLSVADGAPGELDPVAVEPLVVIQVSPASPAEQARVRAGDEILAINDVPPYVNGVPSPGVLAWITDPIDGTPITLVLHRPVTDATMTVIVTPSSSPGPSTAGGAPTTLVGPGGGEPKLVDEKSRRPQLEGVSRGLRTDRRQPATRSRSTAGSCRGHHAGHGEEPQRQSRQLAARLFLQLDRHAAVRLPRSWSAGSDRDTAALRHVTDASLSVAIWSALRDGCR
jgi:hypothetical protein